MRPLSSTQASAGTFSFSDRVVTWRSFTSTPPITRLLLGPTEVAIR